MTIGQGKPQTLTLVFGPSPLPDIDIVIPPPNDPSPAAPVAANVVATLNFPEAYPFLLTNTSTGWEPEGGVHAAVIDVRVDAETVHGTCPTLTRMSAGEGERLEPATVRVVPERDGLEMEGVLLDAKVNPHKLASEQRYEFV